MYITHVEYKYISHVFEYKYMSEEWEMRHNKSLGNWHEEDKWKNKKGENVKIEKKYKGEMVKQQINNPWEEQWLEIVREDVPST